MDLLGEGSTWIIVGLLTKQYLTIFSVSTGRYNLNTYLLPTSHGKFNSGVLTMSHISKAYPLPCNSI